VKKNQKKREKISKKNREKKIKLQKTTPDVVGAARARYGSGTRASISNPDTYSLYSNFNYEDEYMDIMYV
jgi:hypothetical protein